MQDCPRAGHTTSSSSLSGRRLDGYGKLSGPLMALGRAWFNGRTAAFQAAGRGSIPRARSTSRRSPHRLRVYVNRFLPLCAAALVCVSLVSSVHAAPGPSARLVPHRVSIGRSATLIASRLTPKRYYDLLLAVPNASKPRAERFITTVVKSDAHGNIRASIQLPILAICGAASLYLMAPQSVLAARASLTLTGCTASKRSTSPPPPPHKK